jgi:hypothetical protein
MLAQTTGEKPAHRILIVNDKDALDIHLYLIYVKRRSHRLRKRLIG